MSVSPVCPFLLSVNPAYSFSFWLMKSLFQCHAPQIFSCPNQKLPFLHPLLYFILGATVPFTSTKLTQNLIFCLPTCSATHVEIVLTRALHPAHPWLCKNYAMTYSLKHNMFSWEDQHVNKILQQSHQSHDQVYTAYRGGPEIGTTNTNKTQ